MRSIRKLIRYFAEKYYFTSKALWKRGQRQLIQAYSGQPIITYQMGKVGSSTVQASLVALDSNRPIYHVHFLNPKRVREIEQQRRKYFRTEKFTLLRRPWLYEFLYEQIQTENRHWKIVTLIREPIARNMSTFFENLEVTKNPNSTKYVVKSDYYGFNIEVDIKQVGPLIELFFDRLVHDRPLNYFNDEIKYVLGVDVFESAFPRDKGYMVYRDNKVDLVLIRLEDLDRCASKAFKDFLDIDDFTLVQTNMASKKVYAPLYKEFKRKIHFPEDYVNRMYESKYARHFYSDEEIDGFRRGLKRPQEGHRSE
jgi:hypothetical protein